MSALQFTRDHLADGYISKSCLVHLFKVDAPLVQAIRHWTSAFYVLNLPLHNSLPAEPRSFGEPVGKWTRRLASRLSCY
jgi:hypothetical protein